MLYRPCERVKLSGLWQATKSLPSMAHSIRFLSTVEWLSTTANSNLFAAEPTIAAGAELTERTGGVASTMKFYVAMSVL